MSILDGIQSPADLRSLSRAQLITLADEMRERLIDVCSRTGGHIGAGLGVVELTIALHYVFDTPRDQLVWDVGHQGYPHKLLTGRNAGMETLRKEGGISGFLKRAESEYDAFGAGHAATAISAALGIAAGRDLRGETFKVAAVLGDGALTSGLAYEGLNNAGHSGRDLVVVLNDNEMSIAPNVGAMSKYLNSVQRNPLYNRLRSALGDIMDKAPKSLAGVSGWVQKWEESVKTFLTPGVLFEELGFRYFGPIDGHDIGALLDTFAAVREMKRSAAGPRGHAEGQGLPGRRALRGGEVARAAPGLRPGHREGAQGGHRQPGIHGGVRQGAGRAGAGGPARGGDHGGHAERHRHVGRGRGRARAVLRRRHRRGARRDLRRRAWPPAGSGRWWPSTPRSCSAGTTTSSTTWPSSRCPWCSAWTAPGWWARTARRTWGCTTLHTCSPSPT